MKKVHGNSNSAIVVHEVIEKGLLKLVGLPQFGLRCAPGKISAVVSFMIIHGRAAHEANKITCPTCLRKRSTE